MSDPQITLTKIKTSKFASHETICFEAVLLVDGKPAAGVSNDGQGGPDSVWPIDKDLLKRAEDYCKSLPAEKTEFFHDDGSPLMLPMDLELFVANLLEEHEWQQTLKRKSKTKTLFTLPGDGKNQYREVNRPFSPEIEAWIMKQYPNATILRPK